VKVIVWFEPERVTPGTWIWEKHPEWLIGKDGGNRLLNLGLPEARQWLADHVDRTLKEQGIDLYRQDFNINPLGLWRSCDAPDRQGLTEIHYNAGYLAYWDELRRRHPGMLIDSCASGGRRNDLETMRRSVPLLRSDDIGVPINEQGHSYGFSFWVPYQGTGTGPDPYGFRSCMNWHMTVGPDARKKDAGYELWVRMATQWRQVAENFHGDYYPLTPYSLSEHSWMAWQFNRPEAGAGMVQAFRRARCEDTEQRFRLRGLDPEAAYEFTNFDKEGTVRLAGRALMKEGLPVTLPDPRSAALIAYKRVDR
jgi:alpha-galactosidase